MASSAGTVGTVRPIVYTRKIRYSDTDAQGIVFNANYLTYLDDANTDLFDAMGLGAGRFPELGYEWVVGRAEIDFRSTATLGEVLRTEVHVAERGRTSFTIHGRVTEETTGRVVIEARQVQVVVDATTFEPAPLPDFFVDAILEVQGELPADTRA